MTETANLQLPLVQASQAQKHVTVNGALVRLDALSQLVLESRGVQVPPVAPDEGDAYAVPAGAVNAWSGHDGEVAISSNGGWIFVQPGTGWRGWIRDEASMALFDGAGWLPGGVAVSAGGAHTVFEVLEVDHVIGAGAVSNVALDIPQYAQVQAVTGRITAEITGTLSSWSLGVAGTPERYASGLGLSVNSWIIGASGSPLTYYSDTALELTAVGGDFAAGAVRLAIHMLRVSPPSMV